MRARAQEGDLWYSAAGQREYERTGICEKCWDLLAQDGVSARRLQQQCDNLSQNGVETSRTWVTLSKVRGGRSMREEDVLTSEARVEKERMPMCFPG